MGFPTSMPDILNLAHELVPYSKVVSSTPLKGGISAQMFLLTLEGPDGAVEAFTLRKPGDWGDEEYSTKAKREFLKYQFAFEAGLLGPEPVKCFDAFFVLRYIDGAPDLSVEQASAFASQLPGHLAKIHRTEISDPAASMLPKTNPSPTGTDWQPRVREILLEHGPPRDEPVALCHGDCWPGNVLWNGAQIVGLIDWAEIHVGPPLVDLAISRFDLFLAFGWETVHEFTRQYFEYNPIDSEYLAYWDLRCSQRIGDKYEDWAASFVPLGRPDVTADFMRHRQTEFIEDAIARL
ncbi:MAG: phosphotransferase [Armatimonadota bacterium]